jgi:DNA modification methylase
MKTNHHVYFGNAMKMDAVLTESIDLMVTSPPYPMIAMWDELFARQSASVKKALRKQDGVDSFEGMHQVLDRIWQEVYRVLKFGAFACINIGDATRTLKDNFVLYPNHMRVLQTAMALGFSVLPCILWRKQTNAPNKFMGSGMLPAGAYVTLEHEYILILRKGTKREFATADEKKLRRESAIFWEERNQWFSDVWLDVKGTLQAVNDPKARRRSGAYPFDIVYRLINMYSVKGDTVLDPFLGTGTTAAAAIASGRNSIGYEIEPAMAESIDRMQTGIVDASRQWIRKRLARHLAFVVERLKTRGGLKHSNGHYGFPVVTAQEKELILNDPLCIKQKGPGRLAVDYSEEPQPEFCRNWPVELRQGDLEHGRAEVHYTEKHGEKRQLKLFDESNAKR